MVQDLKQIIIDGIDVSGCVRLQDDNISCDLGGECKYWDNCYYKQLKRKEQECERWKSECERWKSNFYGKVSGIEELLQQLDQLKQTLAEIKDIAKHWHNEWINDPDERLGFEKILQTIGEVDNDL